MVNRDEKKEEEVRLSNVLNFQSSDGGISYHTTLATTTTTTIPLGVFFLLCNKKKSDENSMRSVPLGRPPPYPSVHTHDDEQSLIKKQEGKKSRKTQERNTSLVEWEKNKENA